MNWTATSDGRVKVNITENVPGLDFVNRLRPVTYYYNVDAIQEIAGKPLPDDLKKAAEEQQKIKYTGFIAQEVQQAAENLGFEFSGIKSPKDINSHVYGIRYAEFVVPLVKAVQELDARNKKQEITIVEQQQTIEKYEASINQMMDRLNKLETQVQRNTDATQVFSSSRKNKKK